MPTILITGANRGLGFALAQSYLKDGWRVFAACRNPDAQVPDGAEAVTLDIADSSSIKALKKKLHDIPIDILWNNAGIYLDKNQKLEQVDDRDWLRSFEINCIAPIRVAEALADNLARSERKVIAFTSTKMASLAGNGPGAYAYRSSKVALNMAVRCFAQDQENLQISCLLLHPGHVRTDMGGLEGAIDVKTSVMSMRRLVDQVNPSNRTAYRSSYFDYDGSSIPW
ncbi:MAG: SDR family oxidoreductase [Motiliproteus sp.]